MKKFYSIAIRHIAASLFVCSLFLCTGNVYAQPLKVGVVGLNHDHAYGLMQQYKKEKSLLPV